MARRHYETLRGNALSGVIAAVIFVVISVIFQNSVGFIVVGAIVVFVVATLISFAIGSIMQSRSRT